MLIFSSHRLCSSSLSCLSSFPSCVSDRAQQQKDKPWLKRESVKSTRQQQCSSRPKDDHDELLEIKLQTNDSDTLTYTRSRTRTCLPCVSFPFCAFSSCACRRYRYPNRSSCHRLNRRSQRQPSFSLFRGPIEKTLFEEI